MKPKTFPGRPPRECVPCSELPYDARPKIWRPTDHAPIKPRCATHQRERHGVAKAQRRETYVERVYGVSPELLRALLDAQDGRCGICTRATGKAKALAMDHDHRCCNGPVSCGECVRGALCGPCNELIGRYGVDALLRAIAWLRGDTPMARLRLRLEQAS